MRVALKETRLGLRNSATRLPFRYGKACLTRCPQALLSAAVEVDGKLVHGYSGDCLPPGWFDKSPGKTYAAQIDDMLSVIGLAEKTFREELASPIDLFSAWMIADPRVRNRVAEWGLPSLLASFGLSMCERAVIDAIGRATGKPLHALFCEDLLGIVPGDVHPPLAGLRPAEWLAKTPSQSVFVRHTVGLADPLTAADIPSDERLEDGFPQALEEYVERCGTRYFKIKVSNQLDDDVARLCTIARIAESQLGGDYKVTLDGNEQYKSAAEFQSLMERLRTTPELATLLANTLVIEQPLERSIALDTEHARGVREAGTDIPIIIDESDSSLDAYARAIELGYRGVSSKACKGAIRSVLNAGLTWLRNGRGTTQEYVITGEDLCTVGVVGVQADLCLAATLGLTHVERNGHHYHPGLTYLPEGDRQAALAAHPDLYAHEHGRIAPHVIDGKFHIQSLQCPGFGFAVEPDTTAFTPAAAWEFASLGFV